MSDYLAASELLATIGVSSPSAQQTSDAQAAVTSASRAIDYLCQRRFYADANATQVRYYSPVVFNRLDIDDLVTLTSLVTRDDGGNVDTNDGGLQTWTQNTDFVVNPLNAAGNSADVWPYTHLTVAPAGSYTFNTFYPRSVKLTGKFGWPATPAPVIDATTLLSERLYKMKREAPLGTIALADTAIHIARADSNLMILLGPFVKHMASVA